MEAINITMHTEGQYSVSVQAKPSPLELQASLQSLVDNDVKGISVTMPAALATDFTVVQVLSFLRKEGKSISVQWTDRKPAGPLLQIIQSIIQ